MTNRYSLCTAVLAGLLAFTGSARSQPMLEDKELLASDGAVQDEFGESVAIDGDTAIVGAFQDLPNGPGAAYVYYRDRGGPGSWGEVKKLTASDAGPNDWFGTSVAIEGDTAIVGAEIETAGLGAAYVFYRNQGGADNWGEVKKLTPTGGPQRFGSSVAIDGDTVLLGAFLDTNPALGAGSAYVFYRDQGGADNWGLVKKLLASDGSGDDYFGESVSIDGDTAAVGAGRHDGLGQNTGSVYVFGRDVGGADNWGEVKRFIAGDTSANNHFGEGVSILGDRVLVGAPANDAAANNAGSAYIFERDEGGTDNWGEVAQMTAPDAADGDFLGASVSLVQDRALVGTRGAASAYIFQRNIGGANNWGHDETLIGSDTGFGDLLWAVSMSGDTAIAGNRLHDHLASDAGSAYLWESPLGDDPIVPAVSGRGIAVLSLLLGSAGWLVGRRSRREGARRGLRVLGARGWHR